MTQYYHLPQQNTGCFGNLHPWNWNLRYHDPSVPDPACPLCGRPIPPDVPQSLHHLIPRLRGGKGGPVVLMHHICHREVHATLTETELARQFNTPDALRAHPRLAKFIDWVARRPPEFLSRVPGGKRSRRR